MPKKGIILYGVSGYRSYERQKSIYSRNVALHGKKATDSLSAKPGSSEHQTGLAIDMSTVDSLNESDPDVVAKVRALAPKYGFVLRFPEGKTDSTGVGYEDWHFRYVGKASAKYMTKHNLTLEEYLTKLKEAG